MRCDAESSPRYSTSIRVARVSPPRGADLRPSTAAIRASTRDRTALSTSMRAFWSWSKKPWYLLCPPFITFIKRQKGQSSSHCNRPSSLDSDSFSVIAPFEIDHQGVPPQPGPSRLQPRKGPGQDDVFLETAESYDQLLANLGELYFLPGRKGQMDPHLVMAFFPGEFEGPMKVEEVGPKAQRPKGVGPSQLSGLAIKDANRRPVSPFRTTLFWSKIAL